MPELFFQINDVGTDSVGRQIKTRTNPRTLWFTHFLVSTALVDLARR
jgi:hypothetical protein